MIASLWEVADVSTSKLMLGFYKCHASATATTKAEAFTAGAIGFAPTNEWRVFSPILLGSICCHWQLAIARFRFDR